MADWVKLDPVALGEWLGAYSTSRERGEWVFGFQAGALGALLRPGATKPEVSGHAKGAQLRKEKDEDKNAVSEKQRARVKQRWDRRRGADTGSVPRYQSGKGETDTDPIPGEEKRGEENSPQGGNGAPPPDGTPEWKRNKAEAARRKIAALHPTVARLEAKGAALTPEAREKLVKAKAEIWDLETEIFGYGLQP